MVKTKQQRRRNRRLGDKAVPSPIATATVTSAVHGTSAVTLTFSGPVQIDPAVLPTTWTFGTTPRHIISIESAAPTVLTFGVSGTVAAMDPYVIGGLDPAARTTTGGYIAGSAGELT